MSYRVAFGLILVALGLFCFGTYLLAWSGRPVPFMSGVRKPEPARKIWGGKVRTVIDFVFYVGVPIGLGLWLLFSDFP